MGTWPRPQTTPVGFLPILSPDPYREAFFGPACKGDSQLQSKPNQYTPKGAKLPGQTLV